MRVLLLSAGALLAGSLVAQGTLPKGYDATEGVEVPSGTPSAFHAGWDIKVGTTNYWPARTMEFYDSSTFPWNPAQPYTINKLSVRRDGPFTTATTPTHTKDVTIIMSTSSVPVNNPNWNQFDGNHGTTRLEVLGTVTSPKTVSFPATAAPASREIRLVARPASPAVSRIGAVAMATFLRRWE